MLSGDWLAETATSYDTVADSYADQVRGALAGHPYLRAALLLFAEQVEAAGGGLVVDVGCGPGEVTAFLSQLGIDAFGIDLAPKMIDVARRDHPSLRFEVGSMTSLELPAASVAGLLAWQSLIHIPDDALLPIFRSFHAAVRPGGPVQLLFHAGRGSWIKTDGYGGHPMNVRVYRRQPDEVAARLHEADFDVEAQTLIDPRGNPQALISARRRP